MLNAADVIKKLGLEPLPQEGGFYRETYRSKDSTAIYFLMTPESFSAIHRLKYDEVWHFYAGDPITVVMLKDGAAAEVNIGPDLVSGQQPQFVVPRGAWFGSCLKEGGKWGLVGCTVSPPFQFEGFELGSRAELLGQFPAAKAAITKLTRA